MNGALRGASGKVIQMTSHRIKVELPSLGFEMVATMHPSRIDSVAI